jgi:predicted dienelactone hydrolase
MKLTSIFGRILRSTHDFIGWTKTEEGYNHIYKTFKAPHDAMDQAHSFTSLPMDKRWFERGEEPKERDFYLDSNPTDPFVDLYAYAKATHCTEKGIECVIHPEFEIR